MTTNSRKIKNLIHCLYRRMEDAFGDRRWWPAETPDELIIGVVLTQNTNWGNVEKAISNLKQGKVCDLKKIAKMKQDRLANLIQPAGYFNVKAKRLNAVATYFVDLWNCDFEKMKTKNTGELREELLAVYGIGAESVDSILLYLLEKPSFVIDAYTIRIGIRHGLFPEDTKYEQAKKVFEDYLEPDTDLFNQFHALFVCAGARYCKPKPNCGECPLNKKSCFINPDTAPEQSIIHFKSSSSSTSR